MTGLLVYEPNSGHDADDEPPLDLECLSTFPSPTSTSSIYMYRVFYVKCAPYLLESKDLSSFLLNIKIDSSP